MTRRILNRSEEQGKVGGDETNKKRSAKGG